jgi:hypothetical protein
MYVEQVGLQDSAGKLSIIGNLPTYLYNLIFHILDFRGSELVEFFQKSKLVQSDVKPN